MYTHCFTQFQQENARHSSGSVSSRRRSRSRHQQKVGNVIFDSALHVIFNASMGFSFDTHKFESHRIHTHDVYVTRNLLCSMLCHSFNGLWILLWPLLLWLERSILSWMVQTHTLHWLAMSRFNLHCIRCYCKCSFLLVCFVLTSNGE